MPMDQPVAPPAPMFPVDEAWLALREEAALDPALPIVDPHHHVWDRPGGRYLFDALRQDLGSGHTITATVFVECRSMYRAAGPVEMRPVGETEFVAGVAAMSESGAYGPTRICAGIVGHADLRLGARVRPVLEALIRAGGGRFRGIRVINAWDAGPGVKSTAIEPPPGLLADPAFREGFAELAPLGLSFDAWQYHAQIPELIDLARAFPQTTIVLDHVGGPLGIGPYAGKRDEVFARWRQDITLLAQCPNVVVKLGGLGMKICGFGFSELPVPPSSEDLAAAWRPYIEHCISAFGPTRSMFESNFPVDKGSCSYGVLWNAFKRLAAGASDTERADLFSGTATRIYRLDTPA
jgi:L-fuconolactonase